MDSLIILFTYDWWVIVLAAGSWLIVALIGFYVLRMIYYFLFKPEKLKKK